MNKKIIKNGYIITMDKMLGNITNGALLIIDNKIEAVTTLVDDFSEINDAEIIDAEGGFILPGLIDTHRHNWLSLFRAISADESLLQFLANTFHAFGSIFSAEDMAIATQVGAIEAINAGTTTVFDVCDCINTPDHAKAAIDSLYYSGIRAVFGYGMQAYAYQPRVYKNHNERLHAAKAFARQAFSTQNNNLISMGLQLTSMGLIPFDDNANEIRLARELDVPYSSHTGAATTSIFLTGLQELYDHELLSPRHIYAHCNGLTEQHWKLIAKTGGKVSTTPSSELNMGMGFLPIRSCLEHDIQLSFGTDYVGVTSEDLFSEMNIGLISERSIDSNVIHKKMNMMPTSMELKVHDALYFATQGGAETLGLADQIGSLTVGKKADIIIVSQKQHLAPSCNPIGTIVQQTHASDVDTVIIDGQIRKRHGQLVGYDLNTLTLRAAAALNVLLQNSKHFSIKTPEETGNWFLLAEKRTSYYFAQAYEKQFSSTIK